MTHMLKTKLTILLVILISIGSFTPVIAQETVTLTYFDFSSGDTFEWEVSIDEGYNRSSLLIPMEDGDTITLEVLADSPTVDAEATGIFGQFVSTNANETFEIRLNDDKLNVTELDGFVLPIEISNGMSMKEYLQNQLVIVTVTEGDEELTATFALFGTIAEYVYKIEDGIMQSAYITDEDDNTVRLELANGGFLGLPLSPIPIIVAFTVMIAISIHKKTKKGNIQ